MELRAKLFKNGGSQAVRLPKEVRFEGETEVKVRKEGRKVILEPVDEWSEEFLALAGSVDEPIERPPFESILTVRDPFEGYSDE